MPRWFHGAEHVPHLPALASAVRERRQLRLGYRRGDDRPETTRVVSPLGLVNKAGVWYLVASGAERDGDPAVFRVGRVASARALADSFARPPASTWRRSGRNGRPRSRRAGRRSRCGCARRLAALAAFPEVFGDVVRPALEAAGRADAAGFREVTLTFEHETAAATRLAGFGGQVEVLSPASVRTRLVATARELLEPLPPHFPSVMTTSAPEMPELSPRN